MVTKVKVMTPKNPNAATIAITAIAIFGFTQITSLFIYLSFVD